MAVPGPRAPSSRGTSTALRIERSAVQLVLKHGYEPTTVDMICADAGVSQRTFFNHFATKDAAIIGTSVPRLDEHRVRAFITSNDPQILADATMLISIDTLSGATNPTLMMQRMQAISSNPALMQRQLERFAAIEVELADVIEYRLARVASSNESAAEIREQSRLSAHLLAGVMRYAATTVMQGGPASVATVVEATRARLSALMPKLGGV